MAGKNIFANNEIYHIFNRGVEKRTIFTQIEDYNRAYGTFDYYRFQKIPKKYSDFIRMPFKDRNFYLDVVYNKLVPIVDILAYCFMPNHFHLLIKQFEDDGISRYLANITNSYTRYFNTRYDRVGHLFQGTFKSVRIESTEQLLHASRYIHLNPVASQIISQNQFEEYQWSSYKSYISDSESTFCNKYPVLDNFSSNKDYREFTYNHIDYAIQLENLKHLWLE